LTETIENVNLSPKANVLKKVNIGIDITNLILTFFAVFFAIVFSLFCCGGYGDPSPGMVIVFGLFEDSYDYLLPNWFKIDIRLLLALLCICVVFSHLSLIHSVGKFPFLKTKLLFGIFGILLSIGIIVLISLMKIAFWDFSAIVNPIHLVFYGGSFYTSLIYASILLCFSITQLILSFVKFPRKIVPT